MAAATVVLPEPGGAQMRVRMLHRESCTAASCDALSLRKEGTEGQLAMRRNASGAALAQRSGCWIAR